MPHYKDENEKVYWFDTAGEKDKYAKKDLTKITNAQADSLRKRDFEFEKEIKAIRTAKEVGGITIDGIDIQTDLDSRANLLGASQLGVSINWKTGNGFVELTSEQITSLAMAVGQHVQQCFNAEKAVYDAHAIEPFADIEATQKVFDNAYSGS